MLCKVAIHTQHPTTPVWIAEYEGYSDRSGFRVAINKFDSDKTSLSAMLSGKDLDMCTVAPTPIIANRFKQNNFAIITAMFHFDTDMTVICSRDAGIRRIRAPESNERVGIKTESTG